MDTNFWSFLWFTTYISENRVWSLYNHKCKRGNNTILFVCFFHTCILIEEGWQVLIGCSRSFTWQPHVWLLALASCLLSLLHIYIKRATFNKQACGWLMPNKVAIYLLWTWQLQREFFYTLRRTNKIVPSQKDVSGVP